MIMMRPAALVLLGLVMLQLPHHHAAAARSPGVQAQKQQYRPTYTCNSQQQLVMCGQIPLKSVAEHRACCRLYRPAPVPPAAAAAVQAATAAAQGMQTTLTLTHRQDLDIPSSDNSNSNNSSGMSLTPRWSFAKCATSAKIDMPLFLQSGQMQITQLSAPQLTSKSIQQITAAAVKQLPQSVQKAYDSIKSVSEESGFVHPGTQVGPAELALMRYRVAAGIQPQAVAKDVFLTGAGIVPKIYPGGWYPPTDTPTKYSGPYAMPTVDIKWSGLNSDKVTCPPNYPPTAPASICAHVSLVELDAQMVYKQALAFITTGNEEYAKSALGVLHAWATTNKVWGQSNENGPLEAGWACASMAKALELLRDKASPETISNFTAWVDHVLMPQMDFYIDVITPTALEAGIQHLWGNWHSSIAECYMAYGILTDNRTRYDKGVDVFEATVADYLNFGRGTFSSGLLGQCSETLRDIYHSQFGLGGLWQAAEMAWQQGQDLYSSNSYALAASMEFHARIIRAYQAHDPSMLPAGFRFGPPDAPCDGCMWRFDIRKQMLQAINLTNYQPVEMEGLEEGGYLDDGHKYLIGVIFLPTAWEVAYNHYAGRLNMHMPETAALLASNWPEAYSFHWGLGTLTHANTAADLFTPGLEVLCAA